jgi:2-polyprenyl-3-methyl-5-hydroxy-6-metoxy-1,4-benzoquinol methylase
MILTASSHIIKSPKSPLDLSKIEEINCPLCEHEDFQLQYRVGSWKIVKCKNCRFVYANPRLQKPELLKIYKSNYFDNSEVGYYHYTANKALRKRNFRKWIQDALPYLSLQQPMKALDVGCAAGYCMEVFRENNWIPYGIELDKSIAQKLRQKGFLIFDTPLIQLKTDEKFNFISLFDVIEHLTDLLQNAAILHSLLQDDGIVVLVTPNYESWQRKLFRRKWFQFKPIEHINYFSKKTLQEMVMKSGFEIICCKRSGQFCDIAFLENRIKKYRFQFLLPLFRIIIKALGLKKKYFYVDTASLYVVLKKKSGSSAVPMSTQPL